MTLTFAPNAPSKIGVATKTDCGADLAPVSAHLHSSNWTLWKLQDQLEDHIYGNKSRKIKPCKTCRLADNKRYHDHQQGARNGDR